MFDLITNRFSLSPFPSENWKLPRIYFYFPTFSYRIKLLGVIYSYVYELLISLLGTENYLLFSFASRREASLRKRRKMEIPLPWMRNSLLSRVIVELSFGKSGNFCPYFITATIRHLWGKHLENFLKRACPRFPFSIDKNSDSFNLVEVWRKNFGNENRLRFSSTSSNASLSWKFRL